MAHPLFARLDRQLDLVRRELGNEIDEYTPRGDASHAGLVDGMALAVNGVRPAVLSDATREPAFENDYRRFARLMLEEKPATQRRRRR